MHLQLGEISTVVVSSPETAKEVMKTHDIVFAQRPNMLAPRIMYYNNTNIGFAPCGGYWRQLRKICVSQLFSSNRVRSLRPLREEEVSKLIQTISMNQGSEINLSEKLFSLVYGFTSTAAFGKKCEDQEAFEGSMKEFIKLASGFELCDSFPSIKLLQVMSSMRRKLEKKQKVVDRILEKIISEHKAKILTRQSGKGEAEDDLIDVLLKFQASGDLEFPLTNDTIKAVIMDVFGAGSETSPTVADWAMSEMLKKPSVMKRAQAEVRQVFRGKQNVAEESIHELKYLKSIIKETLRLHPPAPLLLPRESVEKCEINGYELPANTRVIVNAWAIGRDPKYWDNAESFDAERFLETPVDYKGLDFEYIPFGAGRRICPGILYGIANVELPLAQLLFHFDWELPNEMKPEDLDMTEAFGITSRRKNDLNLIPIVYHPLDAK